MATTKLSEEQGKKTRLQILQTGLELWPDVTASAIAAKLGISHVAVLHHFPDIKDAVAQFALEADYSPVIVQMLATNHNLTRNMSGRERLRHFSKLAKS